MSTFNNTVVLRSCVTGLGAGPNLGSYATSFPLTENPISEGGRWRHDDPLQTPVKTIAGIAYGTQDGTGGFDDSDAFLSGFGPNHRITTTLFLDPGLSGSHFREGEHLLRWSVGALYDPGGGFGNTHSYGYEVSFAYDGAYAHVGRFKGADLMEVDAWGTPATGDTFTSEITDGVGGPRIKLWWNSTLLIDVTDTDAVLQFTTGNPGIGFYTGSGAVNTDLGFSDFSAGTL